MTWNLNSFDSAVVDAQIVTPLFRNPFSEGASELKEAGRTRMLVDQFGHDVGHATPQFTLVRTPDLVGAVECAADEVGLNLVRHAGLYRTGKSVLVWEAPDQKIKLKGDGHVTPWLIGGNGYAQGTPLSIEAAACNSVCLNGMTLGTLLSVDLRKKHQGDFNLIEVVRPVLQLFMDKVEVYELELEIMQTTKLPFNAPVYGQIKEITPKRYHGRLGQAIRENAREYGPTAMATLQAATEVASHDMKGLGGMAWTKQVTQLISAAVEAEGVEMKVS